MQSTRNSVLTHIRDQSHATIRSMAESLGLAIPTVRHHVMVLEKDGMIESNEVRIGVGRPSLRYRLTMEGHESFPKKYDWLSKSLLSVVRSDLGEERLHQIIRRISRETIAKYGLELEGKNMEERAEILKTLLHAEGYITQWGKDGGYHEIHFLSCPFRAVSSEYVEICQLDREIIEGVMDVPVKQTTCIVQGDSSCKFRLQSKVNSLQLEDAQSNA
jgi:predicted ArsR family transcriptional regulator